MILLLYRGVRSGGNDNFRIWFSSSELEYSGNLILITVFEAPGFSLIMFGRVKTKVNLQLAWANLFVGVAYVMTNFY